MIRLARPEDVPRLVELVVALATYEREPDQVALTPGALQLALFGPDAVAGCHVAVDGAGVGASESGGEVVGMAIWFRNYSTWTGVPGLYLEDLYVEEAHRGAGHGRDLLAALAAHAVERGYHRVDWSVLDWNAPSIAFYESLGARPQREWTTYRLTGDALARVAAGHPGRGSRDPGRL